MPPQGERLTVRRANSARRKRLRLSTMKRSGQVGALLVLNPEAGRRPAAEIRAVVEAAFAARGTPLEVHTLEPDDDIRSLVRAAVGRGVRLIIASGGDGTVSAVAGALVYSGVPMAILPMGTANVLARELNVPLTLEGASALAAAAPRVRTIDALQVGEQYAVLGVGIGLGSVMTQGTSRTLKRRLGRLGYLGTLMLRLFGYQSRRFTVMADSSHKRVHALHIMVANGGVMGMQPLRWGPDIVPDDGQVDVAVLKSRSLNELVALAWHVLLGKHERSRYTRYFTARRRIAIDADTPLPIEVDGEIVGTTPVQMRVVPHAVRVIVPAVIDAGRFKLAQPKKGLPMTNADENHQAKPPALSPQASPPDPTRPDLSPEGEQAAEKVRGTLEEALRAIRTPEHADQVVARMLDATATAPTTVRELREREGSSGTSEAAQSVAEVGSKPADNAEEVLHEAARQIARGEGEARAAVEQGAQEALNPEQSGVKEGSTAEQRSWMMEALIRRMGPVQKVDARLFLLINRMPHTRWSNWLMYLFTSLMNLGGGWVLFLLGAALLDRKRGVRALHSVLPPLWLSTMAVEYPIKHYFRRRRPFIDVVQAVAVGRKPGTYSFPSGHSAAAFAGAWLLSRHYPELRPMWYAVASAVGFSRVYLGVHYPGDVMSGALTGTVLAEASRWMMEATDEGTDEHPLARLARRIARR